MHAVVRTYSGKGAKELFDILEKNKGEVERLIRAVKGFKSFSLVRTSEGGFSVSVFNDKEGTAESIRVARDWIAKNAANTGVSPTLRRHVDPASQWDPCLGRWGRRRICGGWSAQAQQVDAGDLVKAGLVSLVKTKLLPHLSLGGHMRECDKS